MHGRGETVGQGAGGASRRAGDLVHRLHRDRRRSSARPAAGCTSGCRSRWAARTRMIVMDDADLDLALDGVLWGAFGTTGQRCTATSRLHPAPEDPRPLPARGWRMRPGKLRLGDGPDERHRRGPADPRGVAPEGGARTSRSGRRRAPSWSPAAAPARGREAEPGLVLPADIFAGVKPGSRLEQEEIFGPVLSVIRVGSLRRGGPGQQRGAVRPVELALHPGREPGLPGHAGARQRHHLRERAHHRRRGAPAVRRREADRQRAPRGRLGGLRVLLRDQGLLRGLLGHAAARADRQLRRPESSRPCPLRCRRGTGKVRSQRSSRCPTEGRVACAQCRSGPASAASSSRRGLARPVPPGDQPVPADSAGGRGHAWPSGIRVGDAEALDKLVRSNLRFVVSVAKKYQNQGVSLADLINEGNLGLIRAAHKFDETKGIKFISYAVWWIRQAILQALAEQSRIVRVPLNRAGTLHRIGKRSLGAAAGAGAGADAGGDRRGDGHHRWRRSQKTLSISQTHLSLDAPLTPGEDNRLLDYLPDTQNPGPDSETFEHALTESIEEVLVDAQGAGGQDPPPLFRARRPGADDAGGDRQPARHHPGAGAPDQGEGAEPAPAREPGARPGELPELASPPHPAVPLRPAPTQSGMRRARTGTRSPRIRR